MFVLQWVLSTVRCTAFRRSRSDLLNSSREGVEAKGDTGVKYKPTFTPCDKSGPSGEWDPSEMHRPMLASTTLTRLTQTRTYPNLDIIIKRQLSSFSVCTPRT